MSPPTPEPLYVLRGHRAAVQCVAFLPNSKAMAAGDAEGELKMWDLESQRPSDSIRAHDSTSGILQVACPTSQPWVISQGRDGVVKCWELHSGSSFSRQPVQQVESGCYNFCRFALLESGQTSSSCRPSQQQQQVTAAAPHTTIVQHLTAQEVVTVVDGFSPSEPGSAGAVLGLGGVAADHIQRPQGVGLLSMQLRQQQQQQQGQDDLCAQVSSLGLQQLSQAEGSTETAAAAAVYEADDLTEALEEQLMLRTTCNPTPCSLSTTTAQAGIATTTTTTTTSSSSSSTGFVSTAAAEAGAEAGMNPAAAGPCYLALPCEDPKHLGIWQLGVGGAGVASSSSSSSSTQRPHLLLTQRKGPRQPQRGQCMAVVLLQAQGRPLHVLTGHEDGSVALWDTRTSTTCIAAAQQLHSEPVMCLAAAADCSSGFSGSADSRLASFTIDIPKGHLVAGPQLPLQQPGLSDVAIRPDGRIAATAGWDAKVRVWGCRKRQPLAVLRWHSQQVACVGFSGDNVLLAAGGRDNFISMWSLYPPQ